MRDPYWELTHAALDAFRKRTDPFHPGPLQPGDVAMCTSSETNLIHLRQSFYEYLYFNGYELREQELKIARILDKTVAESQGHRSRPCVVLERYGPDSYIICFLATMNYRDTVLSPAIAAASIPFGNNQEGGLRVYPDFHSRMMIALPLVRSNVHVKAWGSWRPERVHLDYGELERARKWVREKQAHLKANIEIIRDAEETTFYDRDHDSNKPISSLNQTKLDLGPFIGFRSRIRRATLELRVPRRPLRDFNYIEPHLRRQNIQWFMKPNRTEIIDASRYLSSLVDPPLPPFRMPPPFFSPRLRASAAFVGRRLI